MRDPLKLLCVLSNCSHFSVGRHEGASRSGEEVWHEVPDCGSQQGGQGEGGLRCGKTVSAAAPSGTEPCSARLCDVLLLLSLYA